MLIFNPDKRISAREALSDAYFDEVRLEEQENFETCNLDLSFIDKFKEIELQRQELDFLVKEKIHELSQDGEQSIIRFIEEYYE